MTGALVLLALRLRRPITVKQPGKFIGAVVIVTWLLSIMLFLVAITLYVLTLTQQIGPFVGPDDPITPFTLTAAMGAFALILVARMREGFWIAFGSAIVVAIAGPMIFELPFDLIVMWRTYPPTPHATFTLLFFLPLFLIEITSLALLTLSPLLRLARSTILLTAALFFVFGVWALFDFAYPAAPVPITLNVVSKILAFAVAASLFLPPRPQGMQGTSTSEAPSLSARVEADADAARMVQ